MPEDKGNANEHESGCLKDMCQPCPCTTCACFFMVGIALVILIHVDKFIQAKEIQRHLVDSTATSCILSSKPGSPVVQQKTEDCGNKCSFPYQDVRCLVTLSPQDSGSYSWTPVEVEVHAGKDADKQRDPQLWCNNVLEATWPNLIIGEGCSVEEFANNNCYTCGKRGPLYKDNSETKSNAYPDMKDGPCPGLLTSGAEPPCLRLTDGRWRLGTLEQNMAQSESDEKMAIIMLVILPLLLLIPCAIIAYFVNAHFKKDGRTRGLQLLETGESDESEWESDECESSRG